VAELGSPKETFSSSLSRLSPLDVSTFCFNETHCLGGEDRHQMEAYLMFPLAKAGVGI
jgi:hypothetical protein